MKRTFIAFTFLALLILTTEYCSNRTIITVAGKWERFNDPAAGSIIEVSQIGDKFQGRLIKANGYLLDLGFTEGDIKWRDIERESQTHYKGKDLLKTVRRNGEVASLRYEEVFIELITEDILHIDEFASNTNGFGRQQKWRRIE